MSIRVCERWSTRRRIEIAEDCIKRLEAGEVSDTARDRLEEEIARSRAELEELEKKP